MWVLPVRGACRYVGLEQATFLAKQTFNQRVFGLPIGKSILPMFQGGKHRLPSLPGMLPAEQEMVAAERIFHYLQLGAGDGTCGSGGRSSSRSSGAAGQQSRLPSRQDGSGSSGANGKAGAAAAATAAGDVEEQRQPLLAPTVAPRLPLPAPAGSGGSAWLHSGHVRFENVWLRYDRWQEAGGSGAPAPAAAAGPLGAVPGIPPDGGAPWVLRGVTLDIAPGKVLPRPPACHHSSRGILKAPQRFSQLSTQPDTLLASWRTAQRCRHLGPQASLV